ncbi:hypothetical protein BDV95DRAFT_563767 [Massariosphaeria phaeospora]|uniref:GRF-type domain-containing protein n=1 Tax=Massariosphaeria phaeospora TaxID=100035 RepID=A0A7C8IAW4_9PLEO|nr:hypothetical protein BDV95DRAFT_563767 [Massariosphaeria phaeospora]
MAGFRGGRGGRGGAASTSWAKPLKGHFANGEWLCDCNPQLPTNHFQVKKNNVNQHRWFRTCQKDQNDKTCCKFFLWDDDARPREARALASNSRTEPVGAAAATPARPQRASSPPRAYASPAERSGSNRKRSRALPDDDEFGFGQEDAAFNSELEQVAATVETPRKAVKTTMFETPARRKLPWQKSEDASGLQTPQTAGRSSTNLFTARSSVPGVPLLTPSKYADQGDGSSQTLTPSSSPVDTPTPSRFKDAMAGGAVDDVVGDVFGLLRQANIKLSESVEQSLNGVLKKHTRTSEGLRRGRDVARVSVKAKDAKIAELTHRVTTLEAELEAEKAVVKHLQWQAETGHQSDS